MLKAYPAIAPPFVNDGDDFLIMDGYTVHLTNYAEELVAENDIIPSAIPPNSSNIRQFMDLILFGLTKLLPSKANRLNFCLIQAIHLSMIISFFMAAATLANIIKSSRNT
jgi:hypothetical protein